MRSDVLRNDVINYVIMTENGNCKFEFVRRFTRQNMADLEAGRGCSCKDKTRPVYYFDACEFELPAAGDVEWLLFLYT